MTLRQKIQLAMAGCRIGRAALRWMRDRRRAKDLDRKIKRGAALMRAAHQLEKQSGRRAAR